MLANYSYLVRPVRNPKKALTVTMKVFIQQVLTVDAKHQMIEVNAWLKYVRFLYVFQMLKGKDYRFGQISVFVGILQIMKT